MTTDSDALSIKALAEGWKRLLLVILILLVLIHARDVQAKPVLLFPKLDPDTKVRFGIRDECRQRALDDRRYFGIQVIGELPEGMNLLDHDLMRSVLKKGAEYALATCGDASWIYVNLYQSDAFEEAVIGTYERSNRFSTLTRYRNRQDSAPEHTPGEFAIEE